MKTLAEEFRSNLVTAFEGLSAETAGLEPFIDVLNSIDCSSPVPPRMTRTPYTVRKNLPGLLDGLSCDPALAASVRALAECPIWYQIYNGVGLDLALAHGMIGLQFAGQAGLVRTEQTRTGLFLIAPGVHYPLHQHAAEEVYHVVAGELTIRHGLTGTPFTLRAGEVSVTPGNRIHELRTGDRPTLLVYSWIGDVEGANWWWRQEAAGQWERICWKRQPDARWIEIVRQPATADDFAASGEDPP